MKQILTKIVCGVAGVVLGCGWLVAPVVASELVGGVGAANSGAKLSSEEVQSAIEIVKTEGEATEVKTESTVPQSETVNAADQVVGIKTKQTKLKSDADDKAKSEEIKVAIDKVAKAPELSTMPNGENKNDQPPVAQVIDLRLVKVQIKQGNLKTNQFVVLKNYGAPVDIKDFTLQLLKIGKGNSPILVREVALGELQFNKTNAQLETGEVLIVVNDLELVKNFINLQTNLVQCFGDCRPTEAWLELSGATKYQLKLIHQPTQQLASQFNYQKKASDNGKEYYQFANHDFLSIVTINGRESETWQGFLALRADPIWLKAEQLPPFLTSEPNCKTGEELINDQCFKRCPKNYTRNLATNICERDPCPIGKILDVATDNCVVDPASCKQGYEYNPTTKRCHKVKTTEPKSCPTGFVFNSATGRCNKITLAKIKATCPDGYLRHPETGRCRKIVLEADCRDDQELIDGKCLKRCAPGQARHPATKRCQKIDQACQAGFSKDPSTGICVKNVAAKASHDQQPTDSLDKSYNFDWLKLLNSPLSGAIAASLVFVVYDKFFRAKSWALRGATTDALD